MTKRSTYKTSAIVLHSLDYGESDRIITFYTDNFGKLKGIAKGARRSKKRFPNALELFSHSNILFSKRSRDGLALIENCDVTNHYPGIRSDLEKTLIASYFIDLTNQFTSEGKKNGALFQLLQDFLELINAGDGSEIITRLFELRLLRLKGFEPVLDRCIACGVSVDETGNRYLLFNSTDGGVKCPECSSNNRDSIPVSLGTIKILLMGKEMETGKIDRLFLSGQAAKEGKEILAGFIRHLLGKELKSLNVLNEVREMGIWGKEGGSL
ncbi:MAG: DNA repair protein RecO [Proteobacteria bacterium]|nr:DNA repair protein RecO [Pseudomonadota bacterium]